ncbi:MAG: ABC transporter permease [Acetobacterales bacterium]
MPGPDTTPETSRSEAGRAAAPRPIGRVNWIGLWTLYAREVRRYLKIYMQTLFAPIVTTLLFLAVFTLALGRAVEVVNGVPFAHFLMPGLVMMAIAQNSFANTSSSLVIAKIQGNIVDVLMPPLSATELALGIAGGGATRGLMTGVAVAAAMYVFVPVGLHDPVAVLFFAVGAALMLAQIGLITGIWADKFDHAQAITNFVITPLAFLSGTFYSIDRLPGFWHAVAHANPFFYMIDGLRYGFLGVADTPPVLGAAVIVACNAVLWFVASRMLASGYKLKT